MSMERSRKDSSREDTVSQVRQRVSLVKTPSNKLCTSVASFCGVPEFEFVEVVMMVGVVFEASVATEPDKSSPLTFCACFLSSSISSTILLSRKLRNSCAS